MCVGLKRQGELTSLGLEEEVVTLHSLSGNTESGFSETREVGPLSRWNLWWAEKNASMPDYKVTFWVTKKEP